MKNKDKSNFIVTERLGLGWWVNWSDPLPDVSASTCSLSLASELERSNHKTYHCSFISFPATLKRLRVPLSPNEEKHSIKNLNIYIPKGSNQVFKKLCYMAFPFQVPFNSIYHLQRAN